MSNVFIGVALTDLVFNGDTDSIYMLNKNGHKINHMTNQHNIFKREDRLKIEKEEDVYRFYTFSDSDEKFHFSFAIDQSLSTLDVSSIFKYIKLEDDIK